MPPDVDSTLRPLTRTSTQLHRGAIVLAATSVLLIFVAAGFPVLDIGPDGTYSGWPLLFFGWSGFMGFVTPSSSALGWWANILLLVGFLAILLRKPTVAIGLMLIAAALSLCSLNIREVIRDEGGNFYQVQGFLVGFWLWEVAMGIGLLAAAVSALNATPGKRQTAASSLNRQ